MSIRPTPSPPAPHSVQAAFRGLHRMRTQYPPEMIKARAEQLVLEVNPITNEVYRRAEIEAILISEFPITRDRAQSFATKAIARLDPDNPKRRTHKKPIARRVPDAEKAKWRKLYEDGLTVRAIARKVGANEKTVSFHLGLRKRKRPVIERENAT